MRRIGAGRGRCGQVLRGARSQCLPHPGAPPGQPTPAGPSSQIPGTAQSEGSAGPPTPTARRSRASPART
eukprot:scaffold1330_cov240-Pinguiococcus_pyrenoidosus.AAC.17